MKDERKCKLFRYAAKGVRVHCQSRASLQLNVSSLSSAVTTLANDPLLTTPFQNMSTSSGLLTFYDGPLVWIDCEMTGLDYNTDRILEIAVSAISF